jgi:hypothetical protein
MYGGTSVHCREYERNSSKVEEIPELLDEAAILSLLSRLLSGFVMVLMVPVHHPLLHVVMLALSHFLHHLLSSLHLLFILHGHHCFIIVEIMHFLFRKMITILDNSSKTSLCRAPSPDSKLATLLRKAHAKYSDTDKWSYIRIINEPSLLECFKVQILWTQCLFQFRKPG